MHQITENLWVGDIMDAQNADTSMFDAVITVCQDSVSDNVSCTYHHFPLSDGPPEPDSHNPGVFEYSLFEQAADTLDMHLEHDNTTLIHCHMGRSRSVTVSASVLASRAGVGIYDGLDMIRQGRPRIQPSPEVVKYGRRYLGQ